MVDSGVQKFKFVSPGVFVDEIDNSHLPRVGPGVGPVVIGRAERGPALTPVTVGSFSEFIEVFGNPIPGNVGGDIWRDGNKLAPTYGAYAAQAWLKNNQNLTYVRLLGAEHTDRTTAGQAGFIIGASHDATLSTGGGFGLFIIDSGTTTSTNTGTLAAVWYMNAGSIELSGTDRNGTTAQTGTCVFIASQAAKEWRSIIKNSAGTITDTITFNFDPASKKYIRSVFNTNPTLLLSNITNASQLKTYFLGETFDRNVADRITGSASGSNFGFIMALESGTINQNDQRMNMTAARTGWFISQDLSTNSGSYNPATMTRLFQLFAHTSGEWEMRNLKVSIEDIRVSSNQDDPYGTFTVVIRKMQDSDNSVIPVERFTNCSLNPFSPNYIAKKIGDQYVSWDDTERRYRYFGNYRNMSKYVYVSMTSDVDAGATNPELLPFGFFGPVTYTGFNINSGSSAAQTYGTTGSSSNFAGNYAEGNANVVGTKGTSGIYVNVGNIAFTGSFLYHSIPNRTTTRVGNLGNPKDAYFGIDVHRAGTIRFDRSTYDCVRKLPTGLADDPTANPALTWMQVFSLDDVGRLGSTDAQWVSGSRVSGTSYTAQTGTYSAVLSAGFNRFTAPLYGGFDGLDIQEREPFNNRVLSGQSPTVSYEYNSVKRAIDSVADPEVVSTNILMVPGITNTGITDIVLGVAEQRRDCLAIIDIEGDYIPPTENINGDSAAGNRGNVDETVNNLRARALNSSYGCAYFPWVQIRDTGTGASLWAPPSVAALGVMSFTEKRADLWIPPAGFTRGGLTDGAAGIPITGVKTKLTSTERDKLYAANINPIASFPAEGIVIYGQKTLQVTPSALDRINVRRLMNYVKVQISTIASTLIFEPDLQTTWDRFNNRATEFLRSVKARFGLEDFRVVLDSTTTTPDLVDRNIMYAKIFLKPAKAIEFIGIDFIISNSGASFSD